MASSPLQVILDFSEVVDTVDNRFIDLYLQDNDNIDNEFWHQDRINRQVVRSSTGWARSGHNVETLGFTLCRSSRSVSDDSEELNAEEGGGLFDFPQVFISRRVGEKSVNTLAEWECVMDRRDEESRMVEVTYEQVMGGAQSRGKMSIPFEEFSDRDLERVSRGHVFRLIVGYSKRQDGSRRRESIVYVRPQVFGRNEKFGDLLDILTE